jgi:1-acyl-sn-glycerol-3-phosphate acyltransferase
MRLPMERREPERSLPGVSSAHPGVADPAALAAYRAVAPALRALWPAALTGAEQLPASGAFLAVANHSGLGVVESLVLVDTWLEAVGPGVPLAAMAHSSLLRAPLAGALLRAVGAVEATREGAELAVRSGASLLLFPGGDHEAMRPLWRAREVDFAGRRGFIRLARALGLPIVPIAITGSHVTLPTLGASKSLAWVTGLRSVGMKRLPLPISSLLGAAVALRVTRRAPLSARLGAAAAAYAAGIFLPLIPSKIGFHVLSPIVDLTRPEAEIYERVTGAIRSVVEGSPSSRMRVSSSGPGSC